MGESRLSNDLTMVGKDDIIRYYFCISWGQNTTFCPHFFCVKLSFNTSAWEEAAEISDRNRESVSHAEREELSLLMALRVCIGLSVLPNRAMPLIF